MILFVDTTDKLVRLGLVSVCHLRQSEGAHGSDSLVNPCSDIFLEFEGGRALDSLILVKIDEILSTSGINLKHLTGIVANIGPGSFTGLRIGLSVVNALGYGLNIPVVGVAYEKDNDKIIKLGLIKLEGKNIFEKPVVAEYGSEPNITKPKRK